MNMNMNKQKTKKNEKKYIKTVVYCKINKQLFSLFYIKIEDITILIN